MIAEGAPVFEPCQGVLRACATLAVASPVFTAEDSVALEDRREELVDAAVAAVGQDPAVLATQRLDRGASIVDWIVAIARNPRAHPGPHGRSSLEELGFPAASRTGPPSQAVVAQGAAGYYAAPPPACGSAREEDRTPWVHVGESYAWRDDWLRLARAVGATVT